MFNKLNQILKVKSGTVFSNFLMSDDPADAAKAAEGILEKMKAEEAAKKEEEDAKKAEEPEDDDEDELLSDLKFWHSVQICGNL